MQDQSPPHDGRGRPRRDVGTHARLPEQGRKPEHCRGDRHHQGTNPRRGGCDHHGVDVVRPAEPAGSGGGPEAEKWVDERLLEIDEAQRDRSGKRNGKPVGP